MNKIRQIERTRYSVETAEATLPADLRGWLAGQAREATLLAHADDGLIWGQVRDGQIALSGDLFPKISPPLRGETLWQLWLFGPDEERFLWRAGDRWFLRHIREQEGEEGEYYDETQMLWGIYRQEPKDGFTPVHEGRQGLAHAVPPEAPEEVFDGERHPLRLRIRHYLEQEPESGLLRVSRSRLVELYVEEVEL